MKNFRFLLLLLCLALLSGCLPGGTDTKKGSPLTAKYVVPSMGIFIPYQTITDMNRSGYLDKWNAYMSDKYETKVSITNQGSQTDPGIQIDLQNANQIYQQIKAGTALPLEEYLKDNKIWQRQPEDFKKKFEYEGHIYAIPKSTDNTLKVTSIRTDWLNKAGKKIPENLQQFMEAGKALSTGNAQSNQFPLIGTQNGMNIDILNAFGLFFTDESRITRPSEIATVVAGGETITKYYSMLDYSTLSYDPELKCFGDSMFKPGAEDALNYVKQMYDNGMISSDAYMGGNQSKINSGDYGTVFAEPGYAKYRISDTYEALPPLSDEHPVVYSDDCGGYTLNPETGNPKDVINMFVEMLYGSVNNYLDFAMGLPDSYVFGSDNVITRQYSDEVNKSLFTPLGLVDCEDVMFGNNYVMITPDQNAKNEKEIQKQIRDYQKAYIDKYTTNGKLVKIPIWFSQLDGEGVEAYVSCTDVSSCLSYMIDPKQTIDSIVTSYRINIRNYQPRKSNIAANEAYYIDFLRSVNGMMNLELDPDMAALLEPSTAQ